jgi:hypothetical protein
MHHSTAAIFLLAATGSFANAQASDEIDNAISVILQNQAIELGSTTEFTEGVRETKEPVGSSGPFTTVELNLGDGVGRQDLRCQILDDSNVPIILLRGENNDTTFADGDGGVWDFQDGALLVSTIICDPDFEKRELDLAIRITLSDGNLATQTAFDNAGLELEEKAPVGSAGPFNTVNLDIGADVEKQDLRCQLVDTHGDVIELVRDGNEDFTFGDGGNGAWNFLDPESSEVDNIICDPAFVLA